MFRYRVQVKPPLNFDEFIWAFRQLEEKSMMPHAKGKRLVDQVVESNLLPSFVKTAILSSPLFHNFQEPIRKTAVIEEDSFVDYPRGGGEFIYQSELVPYGWKLAIDMTLPIASTFRMIKRISEEDALKARALEEYQTLLRPLKGKFHNPSAIVTLKMLRCPVCGTRHAETECALPLGPANDFHREPLWKTWTPFNEKEKKN